MKKVFNTPYKITQGFGERPDYYKQFGLKGHEGIDLIPSGSDWAVLALADGVVVTDDDIAGDPRTDSYGKFCTIWHPQLKKATMYCHLSENYVSLGDRIKEGQGIGKMGATGNTQGAHLHLNLFDVDDQGNRKNRDNGFLGGTDPKPFLETDTTPVADYKALYEQTKKEKDAMQIEFDNTKVQLAQAQDRIKVLEKITPVNPLHEEVLLNVQREINRL